MKIMEGIYGHLMRVGIKSPSHQTIKNHRFNVQNSTPLFILILNIGCVGMYLIYGASNLKEYADCIFVTISVATATANLSFVNWKMAEIFRFFDNLEDVVNTSKCYIEMKLICLFVFFVVYHAASFYRTHEFNIENHLHASQ